jgi:class 3 adenylate cyclase
MIAFGMNWTPRQIRYCLPLAGLVTGLAVFSVDVLTLGRIYRPIRTGLEEIASGQQRFTLVQQALVQTLNLPLLTFIRIMTAHIPTAIVVGVSSILLLNVVFDLGVHAWQLVSLVSVALTVGISHAILEYFAVSKAVRPVIPFIREHTGELVPELSSRVMSTNTRQRLFFVTICMTFMPFVVLGATVMVRINGVLYELGLEYTLPHLTPLIAWIVMLVVVVTVVMIGMAILMSRDIQQLVDDMVDAMHSVEAGDVDVRLEVTSTDEFATLYTGFNRMTQGLRERERLRDAFGRYVAPELAEEVMRDGVSLGGQIVNASVLFADIREFTALSEWMDPAEVVSLLNRYFAAVEPAIRAEGGWINKFGGDSLLAIFGAPVPQSDHVQRAVRAALGIRAALSEFNRRQREGGGPTLRIGIGIDCGEMVAGSVGSPERMEYTVIGDVVNVASRIDTLNKKWGTDILISAGAHAALNGEVSTRAMPPAEVPGKSGPLQVYAIDV